MKFLSVCSGIEAASVAWKPLGWEAAGFAEIEKFPSAVLAHHYPNVPNHGDMTKWKDWNYERGSVDVICGGTPCQSFSVAGLRKGLDDPRGNLMLTFLAMVNAIRPRWVVWENVPGVLSSNGGKDFGSFLGGLGECGYGFAYRVLDAQFIRVDGFERAVPQRRRRVFVVGHLGSWQRAAAVLLEQNSLCGNPPPSRKAGQGFTRDARSGSKIGSHWDGSGVHPSLTQALKSSGGIGASNQEVFSQRGGGLVSGPVAIHDMATRHAGTDGSGHNAGKGHGLGVSSPGDPMFTLTSGDKHAVAVPEVCGALCDGAHNGGGMNCSVVLDPKAQSLKPKASPPMSVRRLTPTECERLMGFPDNYTRIPWRGRDAENCPDGPRYKALGNSWAVNCARWVGSRIQMVDELFQGLETRQPATPTNNQ